tara:strand:+ start:250 stop:1083 length:834 start_codon:yes stop_codon:yes gene_type:complete
MNQLDNQQVILLTILVSFVTSIATGIFTVTLLDQAPKEITNTINRVVERTVEVVTPPEKETIVRERIVVDRSGEAVVSAVEAATPAIVNILVGSLDESSATSTQESLDKVAVGFFTQDTETLVSVLSTISEEGSYYIEYIDDEGNTAYSELSVESFDESSGLTKLHVIEPYDEDKIVLKFSQNTLTAGQTAIVLDPAAVSVTFISSILDGKSSYRLYLDTETQITGRPVIDVKQEVIGVLTPDNTLIQAETIKSFLEAAESSEQAQNEDDSTPTENS